MERETNFSQRSLKRVIQKHGADRVSNQSPKQLDEILEKYTEQLVKEANKLAQHADRKTIRPLDLRKAEQKITQNFRGTNLTTKTGEESNE